MLTLLLTHPVEFRTLLQYKVWHEPKRDITQVSEHPTSGWDRPTMRRCWEFLDQTSRSFSGVIKELEGDLARVVSAKLSLYAGSRARTSFPGIRHWPVVYSAEVVPFALSVCGRFVVMRWA